MELLQCDGCDFRAESCDDLKTHIQEVHTVFLQPADADESDSLKEEDEDKEDEEEYVDQDDKDYTPSKAGMSPNSTDGANQISQKQAAETHLPFYQCKFCVRYFRSKSFLRNHTKKVHNVTEEDSDASISSEKAKQPCYTVIMHNDNSKMYSCQHCTYKSPRKARILKHQLMYHNKVPSDGTGEHSENVENEENSDSACDLAKGTFPCEWCDYQTDQKDSWTNHVVKEHSDKVKIISGTVENEGEAGSSSPKPDSPSSSRSPTRSKMSSSGNEESVAKALEGNQDKSVAEISSIQYAQISAVTPNSTGSSILSKRFASPDVSNCVTELDSNLLHEEDSRSSLEDDDDDEELGDIDDPNYTGTLSADVKQLLTDDDNKLLETKGIPFRKYMNRFQCPFCSFLTMHRRSISRHIENIHLSGKATVYKCDECPFICTSPLKLGTHKQTHNPTDLETLDLTGDSPEPQNESASEPVNGGNISSRINGKKATSTSNDQQNPHRCTLCSFSTTTLKGLRVHQQHKHSYCDDLDSTVFEAQLTDQPDSEVEASPIFLQKTQTPILGLATKKALVSGKRARKSINDLPLDLSSVKKRTRIDEIASNLQSKISQSQQDAIINLDDMDDEDALENNASADEGRNHDNSNPVFAYTTQQLHARDSAIAHEGGRIGKRKSNPKSKPRSIPISLTLSDDSENISADPNDSSVQDNMEYSEGSGTRFYCKHCDYHNKSARSVSTHYQRMHPYIKFSFKYILDPEDQSAVFRCLECYIEYTNYNDLHQHYMDHHPEASNVLNFNQPHLLYMCRFCSYTSPNVRSLMPHYQRMHPTVKINNAMIFSSYIVEQSHKTGESQTLREILNSGPKNFNSSTSMPRSSSSPVLKTVPKSPEASAEAEPLKETMSGNVVVYDCDVCSFASPNMHSVLVHYQKKHPEQKASYFRIQKTMKVVSVDQSHSVANSSFSPSISTTPKHSSAAVYGSDEEMYYCKHCVYSNRSVVGVLVHYQKRHPEVKVTAKYIKHGAPTPGLMKLMDELQIAAPKHFLKQFQNNGHDSSSNSSPKLGASDKGEDELFFCQHCDYGNRTVKGVLIHYQKKHRETKANADLVRRHTAVVRSQRERAQMVQSGGASSAVITAPPDPESATPLRSLKCKHCSYTSPYVYALKKHLKKEHPTVKATALTILHWAYQDGILEAGYHCEWCIYSHSEPQGLLLHYQRRHPEHNVDYAYMASKLWAGPETTQQGGNMETKHYKCRDCAFEACTIWDITSHYQAVHPWAVKGDESVLLDIIKDSDPNEQIQQQVAQEQAPLNCQPVEEDGALIIATPPQETNPHPSHPRLSISNNPYQCTVCLSEYNSLHGLLTHYGKKHPGMKVKAADFAQEADINPSSVYKCRHCPYVNSRIHGVLTHYQKRHPLVKVTAEDFADDIEQITELHEGDDKFKTQRQGYGAYRCKMCPYTHGTLEKLKIHYEKYHNQSASDMFSPSLTHFSSGKETEPIAECSGSIMSSGKVQDVNELDVALSQLPVNKTEKHAIFKCQLCKYFCSTRKGIARHYRIKHNNVRAQPEGKNNVFKCALCSYTNPIRKGLAAHYQKRHDIDAYYTHCLAASKTMSEKPNKVIPQPPLEAESSEMSEDLRLAVERRRCNLCGFQAFSRKSIVSHYIKRHPGVFPKKQHSSKLGRYFTVIYAKEPEKVEVSPLAEEVKEILEVPLEPEQDREDKEDDWLPFKCLKCFRLSFSTGQLLSMHYNDHHSIDLKRDFLVSPAPEDEESELYQCSHCELKFLTLPCLAKHLLNHNEEFQKRAMRQERRKQLLSKQKASDLPENKLEKENPANKTPIGFKCNFCVEIHPTLRAICNHLRKHVQYGEIKEGHVKQEVSEVPLTLPSKTLTNGDLELDEAGDTDDLERPEASTMGSPFSTASGGVDVAVEALDPDTEAIEGRAAALVAAARAVVSESQLKQRLAAGGHACAQCDRVFMSMQGLRSHERSHSAMALFSREDKYSCQYCQFVSPFRHNLDRHVQSHHGHHKPFKCKFCPFKSAYLSRLKSHLHKAHTGEQYTYKCLSCPFSTMTISQLKEHSLRDHGESLTLPKLRAATQAAHAALRPSRLVTNAEQASLAQEDPSYLEPADVRQQLSHYKLASRSQMSSSLKLGGPTAFDGRPDGVLTCEFCEFSSGYMQSLRRHYRDRHGGKKLFKCKDCSFFTCNKNTFNMHVEAGHNNTVPEELPKDLRCPLCLYHTKHKSNMIDHIVLHREERVAPLEISRSKLSRHLQGLVFRCHKCTFTCSSDQALQQHLQKHDEIKPYQCQLCYYDSSRRSQLEEHLRLEHKVVRNFELMGRVNLDQLEMIKGPRSSTGEEEEREMMQMMVDGEAALEEEEQHVEEIEDDDEAMEMMDYMVDDQREMDGEDLEDNLKEDEDEGQEEEEEDNEVKEAVEEKPPMQEVLASPSSSSTGSGPSSAEKRLPCEFCGRCFTNSLEWERHVLRHGMVVNNNRTDTGSTSAIEASVPSSTGSSVFGDTRQDVASNSKEEDGSADLSLTSQSQYAEDKEMLDTKRDQ